MSLTERSNIPSSDQLKDSESSYSSAFLSLFLNGVPVSCFSCISLISNISFHTPEDLESDSIDSFNSSPIWKLFKITSLLLFFIILSIFYQYFFITQLPPHHLITTKWSSPHHLSTTCYSLPRVRQWGSQAFTNNALKTCFHHTSLFGLPSNWSLQCEKKKKNSSQGYVERPAFTVSLHTKFFMIQ